MNQRDTFLLSLAGKVAMPAFVILLMLTLLLGGCSSTPVERDGAYHDASEVRSLLRRTFTFEQQFGDGAEFHTGETRFRGDCDDFSLAAAYQLYLRGYDPELVFLSEGRRGNHLVTCVDGWCLDNQERRVYQEQRLTPRYRVIARRPVSSDSNLERQFERLQQQQ